MRNILIVDDELPIREWFVECVQHHPKAIATFSARNGEEAVKLLESQHVDILFTDITMPKMDGLALLEHVKARFPKIPVVIISVNDEFEFARNALKRGAFDYILKNEISKENVFVIIDKICDVMERDALQTANDEHSFEQIIRSKYLQQLLIRGDCRADIQEMRQNRVNLNDSPLFAIAMPDVPKKIALLNLNDRKTLHNITFFSCGARNRLLLVSNIENGSENQVLTLVKQLKTVVEGNIGHSAIKNGVEGFLPAVHEAISMLNYMFYRPENGSSFKLHTTDDKDIKKNMQSMQNGIVEAFKAHRRDAAVALFRQYIDFIEQSKFLDVDYVKNSIVITAHQIYSNSKLMDIDMKKFENGLFDSGNIFHLRNVLEEFYAEMEAHERYSSYISHAIGFIGEGYMQQISLKDVADSVFLSEEYFSRLFKKEVGVNFSDYLTKIRMNEAMRLLVTSDLNVSSIAEAVGISNSKYFSLLFKRHFDKTPSQARGG